MRQISFCVLVLVGFISGCATLFSSGSEEITIDSEPSGADVFFEGENIGKTPLKRRFTKRTETYTVKIQKAGYETRHYDLYKTVTPAAWFNIGFITTTFGATSWGIDALSGNMFSFAKHRYVVELEKAGKAQGPSAFQYAMVNYETIQKNLAQSNTEEVDRLCGWFETSPQCSSIVASHREELVGEEHSLAFYRKLKSYFGDSPELPPS